MSHLLHRTAQMYCLICCTGLSIVSPPWLLRSLAQGTPDRCLHMSLDASRHLPPSVQPRQVPGSSLAPSADGAAFPQDLADRQSRQTFVQQLQDQEVHQQWGKSTAPDCTLRTAPASVCAAVLCKCSMCHTSPVAMPTAMSQLSVLTITHLYTHVSFCLCLFGELAGRLIVSLCLGITYNPFSSLCTSSEAYSAGMYTLHMVSVSQGWRSKHYRRLRPCWMR